MDPSTCECMCMKVLMMPKCKPHKITSIKIQDQENKIKRNIRLSLFLLKESLIGWKGLDSKHDFQND